MSAQSRTWPATSALRADLLAGVYEVTNEICEALDVAVDAWLTEHGRGVEAVGWWTGQLADGRIVGRSAACEREVAWNLEFWWGSPIAWVVPDPSCAVLWRYLGEVASQASRSDAARTFPLTEGPVDHPFRAGEAPAAVQPELFDLGAIS